MNDIEERYWNRLLETIRRGKCILVLGSDVSVRPDATSQTPLTALLAETLAESLPAEVPVPDGNKKDLALVAQLCLSCRNRDRYDLEMDVKEFYEPFNNQTSQLHRDLASLPFTLSLTMTPDHFMAEGFRRENKSPICSYYNFANPGHSTPLSETGPERPIVYGLFGDLENPESMVLSETEQLDFLDKVVRGSSSLPSYIAAKLADPQTSFLFMGFGFQRWYSRILLHVLQTFEHRPRSLALESKDFFEHPDREHTVMFFEQIQSVEFQRHSMPEFAAELRKKYAATEAREISTATRSIPDGSPKVFLCHDSRDRERVINIQEQLQRLGIATWRDQQNLRGGDDWDRQIRRVIQKQIDYVLVLETQHMISRSESYLHKEISEALERQKGFDAGRLFVIPATLEINDGLRRLDHFHRVDITNDDGIRRLATEIQDDWQHRETGNTRLSA